MRVLVAEDDIVSRKVLEKLLREWGYEVYSVTDGQKAWEILQLPDAPSLVILDWMMPGMDGPEVCREIRKLETDSHRYVIMLTGKDQKKDLIRGFEAGADDYVTKPFDCDELKVRINAGERIVRLQTESAIALESLRKQATRDSLTGILNRSAILEQFRKEFSRGPRTGKPVSVIMADLDHFKVINDTYGHRIGDYVLSEAAKAMASVVRSYESVGRYGGEEFLVVLSDCSIEAASFAAERCRQAVSGREYIFAGNRIPVTASFGIASSSQFEYPNEELVLEAADAALYRAKAGGRDQVQVASTPSDVASPE